jgi:hypothetical protein
MDTARHHRDLDRTWQRWLLFAALMLIVIGYCAAFALFATRSQDFLVARYNQRALDFSRAHIVSAPAKLSFGLGEPDNPRLGGGWHAPDGGGAWSQALDAFVEIVVPREHAPLLLRVNATAAVLKQRPKMRIKAFINGVQAIRWVRYDPDASGSFDLRVPASEAKDGRLEIRLRVDHTASPFRLGAGPDSRQLGVLLHSIELLDAGASP